MALELAGYNIATILAMLFMVLGSYTIGWLFLRIGWPNIRKLDQDYRAGWSLSLGMIFSLLVIITVIAFRFVGWNIGNTFTQLIVHFVLALFIAVALLEVRRKAYSPKKGKISVPKKKVEEEIAAKKTERKGEEKLSDSQIGEIEKALEATQRKYK